MHDQAIIEEAYLAHESSRRMMDLLGLQAQAREIRELHWLCKYLSSPPA